MATMPPHRHAQACPPAGKAGLRRVARRLLTLVAAVVVGAGMFAVPAHAAPTPEEIEAAIDKQWEQLEPTIEQYNKVRAQLKVNRKKSAELEKKIQPLALQSELAMNRVGDLASHYYMTGPSQEIGALLVNNKPGTLAEQLTMLDRLAAHQRKELEGVLAVRRKYDDQKRKLDELIAAEVKQEKDLAAKKTQINAEIKRLQASMPKTTVKVAGCPTINGVVSAKAQTAIRVACQQVGDPYVWGADGPDSFDCSGLTQYAYKAAGIYLTHHTGDQWNEGRAIPRSEARPGDLVFFFSDLHHMGLYLGNDIMVHAPRTGKPVQVSSINYMPVAGFRRPY
ncbi:cell wall-associated NlpC family hydrolase [Micromonospora purpureochromogenes]|uniref:Cell wall-associated NlpC family hydrolase n=1 Tax=Micromonospora purpureochromogenes TaxID=47872 RepID=A0ABX2RI23_9ACTN|nr:cell wall-associated NlpC family hydrolase [Micromonospora purpureochromogenes]